jgi:hypothetical protein
MFICQYAQLLGLTFHRSLTICYTGAALRITLFPLKFPLFLTVTIAIDILFAS